MVNIEDAILDTLDNSDLWLSASNIAKNTGYTKNYVRTTCKKLQREGYLEMDDEGPGHPFYRITEKGKKRNRDGTS